VGVDKAWERQLKSLSKNRFFAQRRQLRASTCINLQQQDLPYTEICYVCRTAYALHFAATRTHKAVEGVLASGIDPMSKILHE